MKKALKIFLIILLIFSSIKAEASVYNASQIKSIVAKQVEDIYKNYTDAELSVKVITLPFSSLTLPDGKVSFVVQPSENKFMARDLEKVLVYVNGKFIKTFNAPVVVKAYENVIVASNFINIGQQITPNLVEVKKIELSNTMGYQLKSEILSKEIIAKKAFRAGEVIDKRFVKFKPDVVRNSNVTVFFNTNNLTISTEALALSDGVLGDNICLINKQYNKRYKGKVVGENRVLVKI